MLDTLQRDFRSIAPAVDFCALRFVEESSEYLQVRQDVPEPPQLAVNRGAMVTVIHAGGLGYAATSDLSRSGLAAAHRELRRLGDVLADLQVFARFLDEPERAEVDGGCDRPEIALKGVQHGSSRKKTRAASWAASGYFTGI